jgi:hypothetical protein
VTKRQFIPVLSHEEAGSSWKGARGLVTELIAGQKIDFADTAAFLWNAFQQPRTISEVVAQALEEYEAAEDTIQNSALNFVHDTLRYALLEEVISL